MPERRRLTVALVVTGRVATEIDGLRRALGAAALRRVPPHITLVAPVNVRAEALDDAVEVVRRTGQQSQPLRLALGPAATFWPDAPVVYLQIGGDLNALGALQQQLSASELWRPRRPRERPFVPHVTLDQRIEPDRIPPALEALSRFRAQVTIDRVTILEWQEADRRWLAMSDVRLERPRVIGRGGLEVELSSTAVLEPAAAAFESAEWERWGEEVYGPFATPDEPYAITARIAGEIVGTATGALRGRLVRLGSLIVAAHWRSHGVGTHLVKAVERLGVERGAEVVRLEARLGSRAEVFYRDLGYDVTTLLPAWRHDRDFIVMERRL